MRYHCLLRGLLSTVLVGFFSLLTTSAAAELPPDGGAEVPISDAARAGFQVGVALLQDPDGAKYEEAYKAFMKAYTESPSWKILGNLGLCALKLERFTDGVPAYERYLEYAGEEVTAAEAEQVRKDLAVMKATSGVVTLKVSGATEVTVTDTRLRAVKGPVINVYKVPKDGALRLRLANGSHKFQATSGTLSDEVSFSLESGTERTVELELRAPKKEARQTPPPVNEPLQTKIEVARPPADTSLQTAGYIVGGLGIAVLVGGGVTTALGLAKRGALEDKCPQLSCQPAGETEKKSFQQDRDQLKLYGTLTTALFISGGVLTASGVTLVVLGSDQSDEKAHLRLTPTASPYFSGLIATGAF